MGSLVLGVLLLSCAWPEPLSAQEQSGEVFRIGPGLTAPKLIRSRGPDYSPAGRKNLIQGAVLFEIVITEKGRVSDIVLLSPLGYGLDEEAWKAVTQFEFTPGVKDGRPVKVLASVQVNFRIAGLSFNASAEQKRTDFNKASRKLSESGAGSKEALAAVESIKELARRKYPPAMFRAGQWMLIGEHAAKDIAAGMAMIERASKEDYGPALYELAARRLEGRDLPQDVDRGVKEMIKAARLGSHAAQFRAGDMYERGDRLESDLEKAKDHFRLCAAAGVPVYQYRLSNLILTAPNRQDRDYLQGVAWLELAAQQGLKQAEEAAQRELEKLSPERRELVDSLKLELVQK